MAKAKVESQAAVVDVNDTTNEKLMAAKGWLANNSKKIMIYGGILIAIAGGYLAYKNFYVAPKENEANEALAIAQDYFKQDSLKLALEGDGKNAGFAKIITKHSGTNAANLANYYAGVCEMKLASDDSTKDDNAKKISFEKAIKYLKNFSAKGASQLSSLKYQYIGDAYADMKNNAEAIKNYTEGANIGELTFAPKMLYRAALLTEVGGNAKKAGELYKELCDKYPNPGNGVYRDAVQAAAKLGIDIEK
jgi:predicted negative regulator of RcsB-dependent stress response